MLVFTLPSACKFTSAPVNTMLRRNFLNNFSFERNFKLIRKSDAARLLMEKLKKDRELKLYKSRVLTVPNILTLSRLTLSPLFPLLVYNGHSNFAFGLLTYCAATDMLDGWIARKFNQKSVLGSILDPVADKVTVSIFALTLLQNGNIPFYLGSLMLSKDLIMLASGFMLRFRGLIDANLSLSNFFDPSVASVEIKPLLLSKINTIFQFSSLGLCILSNYVPVYILDPLNLTTAFTTVVTAIMHLFEYRKVVRKLRR